MLSAQKMMSLPLSLSFCPISAITTVPKGSPVVSIAAYFLAKASTCFARTGRLRIFVRDSTEATTDLIGLVGIYLPLSADISYKAFRREGSPQLINAGGIGSRI